MTPKPVTPEGEKAALDQFKCDQCDELVRMAVKLMTDDVKAPFTMIIDRFFVFAATQGLAVNGRQHVAEVLRTLADAVEGGMYDPRPGHVENFGRAN